MFHRSGVFFKALANLQWDQLLETDIISKEYIRGVLQTGVAVPGFVFEHLPDV